MEYQRDDPIAPDLEQSGTESHRKSFQPATLADLEHARRSVGSGGLIGSMGCRELSVIQRES
jgi:hypothetical protein